MQSPPVVILLSQAVFSPTGVPPALAKEVQSLLRKGNTCMSGSSSSAKASSPVRHVPQGVGDSECHAAACSKDERERQFRDGCDVENGKAGSSILMAPAAEKADRSGVPMGTRETTKASAEAAMGPNHRGGRPVLKEFGSAPAAGCAPRGDRGCGTEVSLGDSERKYGEEAPCGGDSAAEAVGPSASAPGAYDINHLTKRRLRLLLGVDMAIRAAVSAVVANSKRTRPVPLLPPPPPPSPSPPLDAPGLVPLQHVSPMPCTPENTSNRTASPSPAGDTTPVGGNACASIATLPAIDDGDRQNGVAGIRNSGYRDSSTTSRLNLGAEAEREDSDAIVDKRPREGMSGGRPPPPPSPSSSSAGSVVNSPPAKKGRPTQAQCLTIEVEQEDKGSRGKEGSTTNGARVSPMEIDAAVADEGGGGEKRWTKHVEGTGLRDENETMKSLYGREEEMGTPMLSKFRPPERASDVLHPWSLGRLHLETKYAMLGRGTFGASGVDLVGTYIYI